MVGKVSYIRNPTYEIHCVPLLEFSVTPQKLFIIMLKMSLPFPRRDHE